jgi:ATP-binding cassette subfamily C protein
MLDLGIEKSGPLASLLPTLRRALFGIVLLSTFLNILLLSGSIYMMLVYDLVIPGRSLPTLTGLLILVVIAYAFQGLLEAIRGRLLVHMASNVDVELEERAHGLVASLSRLAPHQDANQPVRDIDQVRSFLSSAGPTAFADLPWVLFFVAVLFLLHPYLGITVLIGALCLIGLTMLTEQVSRPATESLVNLNRERQQVIETTRRHADVIHAMGMQHRLRSQWRAANTAYRGGHVRLASTVAELGTAGKVFRMLLQSIVLSVGALLVLSGKASGGVIFASSILSSRALAPIELVIANWRGFVGARQSWFRLIHAFEVNDKDTEPKLPLPSPSRQLSIEGLTLVPAGGSVATVRNVSMIAFAGEAIAVLGPSGCGKSTLLRGLAGILPAASGDVRLDGATFGQWSQDVLGNHIGYLPQNVELLPGTVADNIARFEPDAPPQLVIAAAKQAGVHDMIQHLPDGYNTDVGVGGSRLSGGQRQRIALARALYRDPFLILLDEPNSNLDQEGELALIDAVRTATARNAIVIAVAHRQSILAAMHNVLVMGDGVAQNYGPLSSMLGKVESLRAEPVQERLVST